MLAIALMTFALFELRRAEVMNLTVPCPDLTIRARVAIRKRTKTSRFGKVWFALGKSISSGFA